MKQLINKSFGLMIGVALVAPALMAGPQAVNGSLGGFSANAQGGQNPGDWGIPRNNSGQNSESGGGQNGAGQGKGPDAGGYGGDGSGQNPQSGSGQNGAGQGKGPDAGGHGGDGNGQNSQSNGGQRGPGEGSAEGEGPTKNNSNNPDGNGDHSGDGPTKNNSNNPDGDGGQSGNGNGSGSGSSSGSSGGGGNGGGDFPPLDPSADGPYDPSENGGNQQIPSACAEAGSVCGQCVQRNEAILQFNRRYLHVAWSTTHQTLEYTKEAIAFGNGVSELSNTSLSWQLAGKPQIIEAVQSLRKTYDAKYRIYINNMEQAMNAMTECETDNYSVQNLYQQFSGLYLDFVKARYQSPD